MNSIRQELGSSIEHFNLSDPIHFKDKYLYTWECIYEWVDYKFGCTVRNKNNVIIAYLEQVEEKELYKPTKIDKSSQEYQENKEYYNFVEMFTQDPIEYHFENTDEEAKSYWWKYLKKSKCYGSLSLEDSNWRNINCYDKNWIKQWVRYETSFFSNLMDINNYVDWERNWKHFTLYSNSKLASEWTYVDWEIEWLRTTYSEDWRVKRVMKYVNWEMVGN